MENKQLDEFLQNQKKKGEERDAKRRAKKKGLNYINLVSVKTPTEIDAMELVPEEEAREGLLVPVQLIGKKLVIAVYDPDKEKTKEIINRLKKDYEVTVGVASLSGIKHSWEHYQYIKEESEKITGKVKVDPDRIKEIKKEVNSLEDVKEKIEGFEDVQTSKILEIVVAGAMALNASDVHLEPTEGDHNHIRYRIDGILHSISKNLTNKFHDSLSTRIKLLSGLKINIEDEPQDGRFTLRLPDRDIELRTSIIPSEYGETVVMRLLDPEAIKMDLTDLGWRKDDLEIIKKELKKPNGLILNTGPTGSGKTTTLYAFLRKKVTPEIKIVTIEDPIEYHLEGISQTQVDRDSDYTFAKGLRSIVRQDPDVILVGEIRDKETAGIALNAALTGHMVFSTLHTNSAVGAIPRLLDLDVKPNIMGPSLNLVIAQRLVRKLCKSCKKKLKIKQETKDKINKFLENLPDRINKQEYESPEIYEAKGCEECNDLGYTGRTSIFELFKITTEIEDIIDKSPRETQIKKIAKEQGMVEMQQDGILKVLKGVTTFDEVERLTGPIEWESDV